MRFRLIDTGLNKPSMNMAIDEALLTSKLPVLRFYGWKPAGLSIGYFQSTKNFNLKNLKKHNVDLVRRPTGGNAVLHDKEVTYSFIIDEKEMPKSIVESYKMISKGLLQGLKNLGLNAAMNENVEKGEKSAVCFNDTSWYEIIVNGKKIVGSAQKRVNGKLLQHGAILIDTDVEKYCSLFNNCNKELINKVKQRMTSINDELKKIANKNPNNKNGFDGFLLTQKTLRDPPTGATPVTPRHCCWGFNKRKNPAMAETGGGLFRRKPPVGHFLYSKKCPSPAMDGWIFSKKINYQIVKQAMIKGFKKELNINFEESKLTKEELKLAKKLESNKYSTSKWNFAR